MPAIKPRRTYSVAEILTRANYFGIVLWISNGEIQADGPAGALSEKFCQTIAEYRKELLASDDVPASLCAACLDAGRETRATWEGPGELMFCESHRPEQARLF